MLWLKSCLSKRSRSTACAVSTKTIAPAVDAAFDLDVAWRLHPSVSARPERFGALLYHFGTRRLSFLKSPTLLAVVRALETEPSARHACESAGVPTALVATYQRALASLATSDMICEDPQR
jgi:putative mycofactocin binding protein MftB